MVSRYVIELIARRIAGDIVWSDNVGSAMRKWREIFGTSQTDVAKIMGISPSVVSDYEKGRRTPGVKFIKRFVEALIKVDNERGWVVCKELIKSLNLNPEVIIDIRELDKPMNLDTFVTLVKGCLLTSTHSQKIIYGYTVLDSIATIQSLSGNEFWQIMGLTTERALIFTKVTTGRSPMIAVRVAPVKPAAVVLHGPKKVDPLAIILAEKEKIPLILSLASDVNELVNSLRTYARVKIIV